MLWRNRQTSRRPSAPSAGRGGAFPSPGLERVCDALRRAGRGARLLDLGPAEQATLEFLGRRGVEIQVASLDPHAGRGARLPDYPSGSFHGILAWDYPVRLPPDRRGPLGAALSRWLAPGGGILLVLPLGAWCARWSCRFRVPEAGRVEYLPQRPLGRVVLPTPREVLGWFPELDGSGATILPHGAWEFFLRRPPGER